MAENNNNINSKDFLLGAVMGTVIGAVTALLLAPKSGRELRTDISHQYQNVSSKTNEIAKNVGTKTKEIAETVGEKSQELAGKAKELAEHLVEDIKTLRQSQKEIAGTTGTTEHVVTESDSTDDMKQ